MRPLFAIIYPAALLLSTQATAAPGFAPNPRQVLEGFTGINPPRAHVPVGALWINGFGPTGEGASADNLETVRSLNGLTIDKNLQLSLSLGLFNLLGIDPKARDHYVAQFTDLAIVRIKDISRLAGIKGEPIIIEALKAGTVAVSSDSEIDLNGQSITWQRAGLQGSGTSGRTRSYSIEAKDMFVAIRVATPELTRSKEQLLRLSRDGRSVRIDDFLIVVGRSKCGSDAIACATPLGVVKLDTQTPATVETPALAAAGDAKLPLPLPISDGAGGLYATLALRWVPPCSEHRAENCGKEPRLSVHYEGSRMHDWKSIDAKGW